MRQYWTTEEIAEHWPLSPDEMRLLKNKTGNTRLGFAIDLKFFQMYVMIKELYHPLIIRKFKEVL
jgi:hypothetical protein